MLSTFVVNPELSVVCFRRDNSRNGPYFAVREFDIKVIRSRDKGRRGRGPSEQAIRASIRQAVLNMNLKSERATKTEIRQLKGHGILGKRAPSCSLLCAEDMIKLLAAFGKDSCVKDLRAALQQERKSCPDGERKTKMGSLSSKRKSTSPRPSNLVDLPEIDVPPISTSKKIRINSPTQKSSVLDFPSQVKHQALSQVPSQAPSQVPFQPQNPQSDGLDALYSALLAFSNADMTLTHSNSSSLETDTTSDSSPYSLPSPLSTSPSTSPTRDPWPIPFPSSPSSPLSDSISSSRFREPTPSDNYMASEGELLLKPLPPSFSFSHPTVLRPRKRKIKSSLAAEISSLSSDIIAKLEAKAIVEQRSAEQDSLEPRSVLS